MKPAPIGSINCYLDCTARVGRKRFGFNGTNRDLAAKAAANDVQVGELIVTDLGEFRLIAAPHDDRANGYWVDRVWPSNVNGESEKIWNS